MGEAQERARTLLEKAKGDAYLLSVATKDAKIADWIAAFHAEQAIEKALKAVLAQRNVDYPRTHNLRVLAGLVRRTGVQLPPDVDRLREFTPYGTVTRYESVPDFEVEDTFDLSWSLECVERTLAWAEAALGQKR
jgi:HEPN domain-containing protein